MPGTGGPGSEGPGGIDMGAPRWGSQRGYIPGGPSSPSRDNAYYPPVAGSQQQQYGNQYMYSPTTGLPPPPMPPPGPPPPSGFFSNGHYPAPPPPHLQALQQQQQQHGYYQGPPQPQSSGFRTFMKALLSDGQNSGEQLWRQEGGPGSQSQYANPSYPHQFAASYPLPSPQASARPAARSAKVVSAGSSILNPESGSQGGASRTSYGSSSTVNFSQMPQSQRTSVAAAVAAAAASAASQAAQAPASGDRTSQSPSFGSSSGNNEGDRASIGSLEANLAMMAPRKSTPRSSAHASAAAGSAAAVGSHPAVTPASPSSPSSNVSAVMPATPTASSPYATTFVAAGGGGLGSPSSPKAPVGGLAGRSPSFDHGVGAGAGPFGSSNAGSFGAVAVPPSPSSPSTMPRKLNTAPKSAPSNQATWVTLGRKTVPTASMVPSPVTPTGSAQQNYPAPPPVPPIPAVYQQHLQASSPKSPYPPTAGSPAMPFGAALAMRRGSSHHASPNAPAPGPLAPPPPPPGLPPHLYPQHHLLHHQQLPPSDPLSPPTPPARVVPAPPPGGWSIRPAHLSNPAHVDGAIVIEVPREVAKQLQHQRRAPNAAGPYAPAAPPFGPNVVPFGGYVAPPSPPPDALKGQDVEEEEWVAPKWRSAHASIYSVMPEEEWVDTDDEDEDENGGVEDGRREEKATVAVDSSLQSAGDKAAEDSSAAAIVTEETKADMSAPVGQAGREKKGWKSDAGPEGYVSALLGQLDHALTVAMGGMGAKSGTAGVAVAPQPPAQAGQEEPAADAATSRTVNQPVPQTQPMAPQPPLRPVLQIRAPKPLPPVPKGPPAPPPPSVLRTRTRLGAGWASAKKPAGEGDQPDAPLTGEAAPTNSTIPTTDSLATGPAGDTPLPLTPTQTAARAEASETSPVRRRTVRISFAEPPQGFRGDIGDDTDAPPLSPLGRPPSIVMRPRRNRNSLLLQRPPSILAQSRILYPQARAPRTYGWASVGQGGMKGRGGEEDAGRTGGHAQPPLEGVHDSSVAQESLSEQTQAPPPPPPKQQERREALSRKASRTSLRNSRGGKRMSRGGPVDPSEQEDELLSGFKNARLSFDPAVLEAFVMGKPIPAPATPSTETTESLQGSRLDGEDPAVARGVVGSAAEAHGYFTEQYGPQNGFIAPNAVGQGQEPSTSGDPRVSAGGFSLSSSSSNEEDDGEGILDPKVLEKFVNGEPITLPRQPSVNRRPSGPAFPTAAATPTGSPPLPAPTDYARRPSAHALVESRRPSAAPSGTPLLGTPSSRRPSAAVLEYHPVYPDAPVPGVSPSSVPLPASPATTGFPSRRGSEAVVAVDAQEEATGGFVPPRRGESVVRSASRSKGILVSFRAKRNAGAGGAAVQGETAVGAIEERGFGLAQAGRPEAGYDNGTDVNQSGDAAPSTFENDETDLMIGSAGETAGAGGSVGRVRSIFRRLDGLLADAMEFGDDDDDEQDGSAAANGGDVPPLSDQAETVGIPSYYGFDPVPDAGDNDDVNKDPQDDDNDPDWVDDNEDEEDADYHGYGTYRRRARRQGVALRARRSVAWSYNSSQQQRRSIALSHNSSRHSVHSIASSVSSHRPAYVHHPNFQPPIVRQNYNGYGGQRPWYEARTNRNRLQPVANDGGYGRAPMRSPQEPSPQSEVYDPVNGDAANGNGRRQDFVPEVLDTYVAEWNMGGDDQAGAEETDAEGNSPPSQELGAPRKRRSIRVSIVLVEAPEDIQDGGGDAGWSDPRGQQAAWAAGPVGPGLRQGVPMTNGSVAGFTSRPVQKMESRADGAGASGLNRWPSSGSRRKSPFMNNLMAQSRPVSNASAVVQNMVNVVRSKSFGKKRRG
ncbi:hypothetical protein HDU96_004068 [Phlyctochytrium bullatum]|nr:hypothetical protein HDU96_004068 [Phlyctochytrium bullatum]